MSSWNTLKDRSKSSELGIVSLNIAYSIYEFRTNIAMARFDTGYWMLDTRYWILDTGYWKLDT